MLRTSDYIDLLRDKTETRSDYAVAHVLGISADAVHQYRKGTRAMSADVALLVAEKLQVPLLEVLADTHAEHAKTPEMRKKWAEARKLWAQVAKIALVAICAAPWMQGLPTGDDLGPEPTSDMGSASTQRYNPSSDGVTIIRHSFGRRVLRTLRGALGFATYYPTPLRYTAP